MRAAKYRRALTWAVRIAGCGEAFGLSARSAMAQGCAMCYQNASASGARGITALRHGILILLLPAVSLFLGIFVFIYRRRNQAR